MVTKPKYYEVETFSMETRFTYEAKESLHSRPGQRWPGSKYENFTYYDYETN